MRSFSKSFSNLNINSSNASSKLPYHCSISKIYGTERKKMNLQYTESQDLTNQ
jgi:hypothetical protein